MDIIANGNSNQNQSVGKKNSKTKFQNFGGGDCERCKRCNNFGHINKSCRADLSKKCSFCQKFGHTVSECHNGGTSQSSGHSHQTYYGHRQPVNTLSCSRSPLLYRLPLVRCT